MASFRTLDQLDAKGKRVLLRADLNVPVRDGAISDRTRIERGRDSTQGCRTVSEQGDVLWVPIPEDNRVALFATGPGCAAPVRLPVADGLRPRGTAWCGPDHLVTTEPVHGGAALIY